MIPEHLAIAALSIALIGLLYGCRRMIVAIGGELQALGSRNRELEDENAILRRRLAKLEPSSDEGAPDQEGDTRL